MNKVCIRTYSYYVPLAGCGHLLGALYRANDDVVLFQMTRWTLSDWKFIGFDNFVMFFEEASLRIGFQNTLIYAVVTCALKVVIGLLFGVFLTSKVRVRGYLRSVVFFPTLVSTIAVGIAFQQDDASDVRLDQQGTRLVRNSGGGLARESAHRPFVRRIDGRMERCRVRNGHLYRRDHVDTRTIFRGAANRRR